MIPLGTSEDSFAITILPGTSHLQVLLISSSKETQRVVAQQPPGGAGRILKDDIEIKGGTGKWSARIIGKENDSVPTPLRDETLNPFGDPVSPSFATAVDIPENALQILRAISTHSANGPTPVHVTNLGLDLDEQTARSAWEYLRDKKLIRTYSIPFTARINANGIDLLNQVQPSIGGPQIGPADQTIQAGGRQPKNQQGLTSNNDLFKWLDPSARNVLGRAMGISEAVSSDGIIHMEHLIKGLLDEKSSSVQRLLETAGVTTETVAESVFNATGLRLVEGYTAQELLAMPELSKHVTAAINGAAQFAVASRAKLVEGIHLSMVPSQ